MRTAPLPPIVYGLRPRRRLRSFLRIFPFPSVALSLRTAATAQPLRDSIDIRSRFHRVLNSPHRSQRLESPASSSRDGRASPRNTTSRRDILMLPSVTLSEVGFQRSPGAEIRSQPAIRKVRVDVAES
ncbi:hypothetical protein C8F04DRAFT_1253374 [Mycena alexandri]|uniref:Uncharacterized protein n=1 Tax=Mycena alexandri TaxID=1745969 RepID=A0AAD6TBG2_9AGAR|nr:hypothetical protein C8F04DRAFT_1253374 [Mycena alexandri]